MRVLLPVLVAFVFTGCATGAGQRATENRWADERLLPVLEAQEHRDVPALCALMKDTVPEVREAAALAFASVQDSASVPCLLGGLVDQEFTVRATSAFALGFIADSTTVVRMAEAAMEERDTTVQRALFDASFIAMQRNGLLKEPNAIIHYFDKSRGSARMRAADALRRLPDSILTRIAPDYLALISGSGPGLEVEAMLVRGLGRMHTHDAMSLLRFSLDSDKPALIIAGAMRALGDVKDAKDDSLFFRWVGTGMIGAGALEALRDRENLDAAICLAKANEESDTTIRIVLLGLVLKHGDEDLADSARTMLDAIGKAVRDPYLKADVINVRARSPKEGDFETFMSIMTSDAHPAERQAAFQGLLIIVRDRMTRARYTSREAQYAELGKVIRAALNSGDAGMISAAAEELEQADPEAIRIMMDGASESAARAVLLPIRDLEAVLLLDKAAAKRDGLGAPPHAKPPFNHPIDHTRLKALKQGQQYRITTNKGEIIIATDVNECPGTCVAFDSLVTAGYYKGKAFHRMVPNFVVQGGCPRGDGYGGMPWTLRTEIARTPFVAGSVGLASAGPDTESCQFFITHSATPHLDGRYTRFGGVVSGMEVLWELGVGDRMIRVERVE